MPAIAKFAASIPLYGKGAFFKDAGPAVEPLVGPIELVQLLALYADLKNLVDELRKLIQEPALQASVVVSLLHRCASNVEFFADCLEPESGNALQFAISAPNGRGAVPCQPNCTGRGELSFGFSPKADLVRQYLVQSTSLVLCESTPAATRNAGLTEQMEILNAAFCPKI